MNPLIDKYELYVNVLKKYIDSIAAYERAEQTLEENRKTEEEMKGKLESGIGWPFLIIGAILGFMGGGIIGAVILGIIGVVVAFLIYSIFNSIFGIEKKKESRVATAHESVELWRKTVEREKGKIIEVESMEAFKEMKKDVPEEYISLDAFDFFIRMLKNGQADTEKELYNMYMQENKQESMMELQRQQIDLANEQLATQQEQLESNKRLEGSLGEISKKQDKLSKQARYGNVVSTLNYLESRKKK